MTNINQVNDDTTNLGRSSLNQNQNVYPIGDGIATNASSINAGYGSLVQPGPAGFGGANRPGRRTFNPLSQMASYTYQLTLYMVTPNAFKSFVDSGRTKIDSAGIYIIAQSGGINDSTQQRAPGFEYDYYIDDLKWNIACSTQSTGVSSANNWDLSFKIIEPYGFSFLTNLRTAAAALQTPVKNGVQQGQYDVPIAWKQLYILGIRYYGYDDNGSLVNPTSIINPEVGQVDELGTTGLFETFMDIMISGVKFKLAAGANTYDITAHGINSNTLLGTKRGRTPAIMTVRGTTVEEALTDFQNQLNQRQKDLVNNKSLTIPNEYIFSFAKDKDAEALKKAKLATPTTRNTYQFVPTTVPNTANSTELAGQQTPNYSLQQFTISQDFPLLQAFDMIIKRSEYLENFMNTVQTNQAQWVDGDKASPIQTNDPAPLPMTWYTVTANVLKADYDSLINDWAFKTEYVFQTYKTPDLPSVAASNREDYYGPHKRYEYFFTGKNTEVIDLQLQFNNLFAMAVLTVNKDTMDVTPTTANDNREQPNNPTPVPGQQSAVTSTTGLKADAPSDATSASPSVPVATAGGQISIASGILPDGPKDGQLGITGSDKASILTYLNDPYAYASAKMVILGDPDFLIRDSVSRINDLYNRYYDTNGYTISASGGQIFIEVAIKQAQDYNERTGVLPLSENFYFINHTKEIRDRSQGAMIFGVNAVTCLFSGGKFTQTLDLRAATFKGDDAATKPLQTGDQPAATTYGTLPGLDDDKNKLTVDNLKLNPDGRPPPVGPVKPNTSLDGRTGLFGQPLTTEDYSWMIPQGPLL